MRRLLLLLILAAPSAAHADTTSWLAIGPGYTLQRHDVQKSTEGYGAFSVSLGVGTDPKSRLVMGGVVRALTVLGRGTDVSLSARGASGGFARGDWGFAVDLGVVGRFWLSNAYGKWPLQLVVTGGAPFGVQLAAGAQLFSLAGGPNATGFFGLLEIDLLRLTVMRQGSSDRVWKNPNPAGGRIGE